MATVGAKTVEIDRVQTLGILGYGSFGRFVASHLKSDFRVLAADRVPPQEGLERGIESATVLEAARCDLVVVSVPVQDFRPLLETARDSLTRDSVVVEVASVKQKPAEILDSMLPEGVRFLGLHPMFGPQSGRDGIRGLKVVSCRPKAPRDLGDERVQCLHRYLQSLGLEVLEMAAEEHDREMAYIQGLPHWIAKALREIHLPDTALATPAYRHLLQIEEILREDSLDLFLTIQRENRFAHPAREELRSRLDEIERLVVQQR